MIRQNVSLLDLCQCLRGSLPKDIDWTSVISLANQTLTTPALKRIVQNFPEHIPQDVRCYVNSIFNRNLIRNGRLSAQLSEAVMALNADGVIPLLLKGSAFLAAASGDQSGYRLISDLDILVSPDEAERALDCLLKAKYHVHFRAPAGATKWYVDLQRPEDVGMIDLQQSLPGHDFFYSTSTQVEKYRQRISWNGCTADIPSATYHAFALIIHDQFQDADYWVGKIDLRHLLDLRDLVNSTDGIDWKILASLTPGRLARNAIETQLVTLFFLLGVELPFEMRSRMVPRLQHWRRMLQVRLPILRRALLIMMLLDYRNYRAEVGSYERMAKHLKSRAWPLPRLDTARFLSGLSQEQRAGKI